MEVISFFLRVWMWMSSFFLTKHMDKHFVSTLGRSTVEKTSQQTLFNSIWTKFVFCKSLEKNIFLQQIFEQTFNCFISQFVYLPPSATTWDLMVTPWGGEICVQSIPSMFQCRGVVVCPGYGHNWTHTKACPSRDMTGTPLVSRLLCWLVVVVFHLLPGHMGIFPRPQMFIPVISWHQVLVFYNESTTRLSCISRRDMWWAAGQWSAVIKMACMGQLVFLIACR